MIPLTCHSHRASSLASRAASLALASVGAVASATCSKATTSPAVQAIDAVGWASLAAKDIAYIGQLVRSGLTNGLYGDTAVTGDSGAASVSGTVSSQSGVSCGSGCVRAQNNTSLSIVFSGFHANGSVLDGTITYEYTEWSQVNPYYTAGGYLCVAGVGSLSYQTLTINGRVRGPDLRDVIISFRYCESAAGPAGSGGSMTTSSGTFSF